MSMEKNTFMLTRTFNAPRQVVFNAFSTPEAMNAWWGPEGMQNTVISLDFTPGGIFHFRMEGHGVINYGRFEFGNIHPYDLLEFTNSFADENAQIIPAPFDIAIPAQIFYRLRFSEQDGKTLLEMTGQPVNASAEEAAGFNEISDSMQEGFEGTFRQLDAFLHNEG
jgi:uncharacterized protein YndB with AHSA1/START domain